jgi:hypothetical protein
MDLSAADLYNTCSSAVEAGAAVMSTNVTEKADDEGIYEFNGVSGVLPASNSLPRVIQVKVLSVPKKDAAAGGAAPRVDISRSQASLLSTREAITSSHQATLSQTSPIFLQQSGMNVVSPTQDFQEEMLSSLDKTMSEQQVCHLSYSVHVNIILSYQSDSSIHNMMQPQLIFQKVSSMIDEDAAREFCADEISMVIRELKTYSLILEVTCLFMILGEDSWNVKARIQTQRYHDRTIPEPAEVQVQLSAPHSLPPIKPSVLLFPSFKSIDIAVTQRAGLDAS